MYLINLVLSELISDENFIVCSVTVPSSYFGCFRKFWRRTCSPVVKSRSLLPLAILDFWSLSLSKTFPRRPGARFSKVPKLFGWHNSLCIFKTKVFRVTKLCCYFNFYSLYNPWKSGSEFYEWLWGLAKLPGILRNARQNLVFNRLEFDLLCYLVLF